MSSFAGLKFTPTRIQRVHNPPLADAFNAARMQLQARRRPDNVEVAFHGTNPRNLPAILRSNLQLRHRGSTDSGWFGRGIYLSRHADYVLAYYTSGQDSVAPVKAGDEGQLLMFDVLPGLPYRLRGTVTGCDLKAGYDSHVSPTEFEIVLFDSSRLVPRYLIDYRVTRAAGPRFDGAAEKTGEEEEGDEHMDDAHSVASGFMAKAAKHVAAAAAAAAAVAHK